MLEDVRCVSAMQLFFVIALVCSLHRCLGQQPHIVLIVADDLGWNDVSFHGSNQIPTPNIDALAYSGIIFNSHYTQSLSSPTKAALLTGKYPIHTGMQGSSFSTADTRALPQGRLMPEYFKNLGYSTHLIGKWHLGYSKWNETPTSRGFDHHFGFYNDFTSYYDYVTTLQMDDKEFSGFDLRNDKEPSWDDAGKYATDLFAERAVDVIAKHDTATPLFMMVAHLAVHAGNEGKFLEAPQEKVNEFAHIANPNRRTYAAMVSKLDDSVGAIVEALAERKMLHNSVIVFISDNGAPVEGADRNWGSNRPLRGIKGTLFEGGIRTVALLYSPLVVQSSRISTDLIHVTDWLPTLYAAANGNIDILDLDIDGIDQWSSIVYDLPSARNDILLNIDEVTRYAALRFYNWKLIVGSNNVTTSQTYVGDSGKNNIKKRNYNASAVLNSPAGRIVTSSFPISVEDLQLLRSQATLSCLESHAKRKFCDPANGAVCLYDIPSDPCEENDLANFFPSVVRRMKRALVDYRKGLIPQIQGFIDIESANPMLYKYTWNPWVNCSVLECTS